MNIWVWPAGLMAALAIRAAVPVSATLVDKPVTVVVVVPKTARRAQALLLQLEQVIRPKSVPVTFNIFAEMPAANMKTSVDDPHFVGYVTALANPSALAKPVGLTVQIADPASRSIRMMPAARFTFVPMEKFPEGGVRIGSIRIESVK